MRLYRVSGQSSHERREWVGTQADAKARAKECGGFFDLIEVPTDKDGLISYLNGMEQREPGCTSQAPVELTVHEREKAPKVEGYAAKACRFEEEFDAMPLATQLHYAAKAMENAREAL